MIYFGIPTYRRAEKQSTLEYLERVGIRREQIYMSVQNEEDYHEYSKCGYSDRVAKLLYRNGHNLSENANTILDNLPLNARIIILDDDIKAISRSTDNGLVDVLSHKEFMEFVRLGYTIANRLHTIGFSVYPCHNDYFMSQTYNKVHIGEGTLLALTNTGIRFDPQFDTKCDYDLTCRIIRLYGAYPRLNMYSCNAPHYTKGGCEKDWKDHEKVMHDAFALTELYPDIVKPNSKRRGEVLMISKKDKVVLKRDK